VTLMTAGGSLGAVAHAVHYAIIVFGLVGVALLLLPQRLHRSRALAPRDAHERRIRELRDSLAAEAGVAGAGTVTTPDRPTAPVARPSETLLPLAVVSSAAAAGVHAAMAPSHFSEGFLLGLFFALSATAQLGWASLALTSGGVPLLLGGVLLNLGCVLLWAITRTLGLPFGLIPGPEAVGGWDVATVVWELVVTACCLAALRRAPSARAAWWEAWSRAPRVWLVVSLVVLFVLSFTAGGS
jgi:hypothetical protein